MELTLEVRYLRCQSRVQELVYPIILIIKEEVEPILEQRFIIILPGRIVGTTTPIIPIPLYIVDPVQIVLFKINQH